MLCKPHESNQQYLVWLEGKTKKAYSEEEQAPRVHRTRKFDMTIPDQRMEFASIAARIDIELLHDYPDHRGHGTGLIRRLRGEFPMKLPPGESNAD